MVTDTDGYYAKLIRQLRDARFKKPETVIISGEKGSGMTYYAMRDADNFRLLYQPKYGRDGNILVEVARKPKTG